MPSSSYVKGARFERRVKKHFEEKGYLVVRQGGSQFPDLIAVGFGKTILIECKYRKKYLSKKELQELFEMSAKYLCVPALAYVPEGVPEKEFVAVNMKENSLIV